MQNSKLLNVVLFAGGRGGSTLLEVLKNHAEISLKVIVNAYDDGLSTGAIRRFVPGMLGPSDVRKNIANLIPDTNPSNRCLKAFIEYRLPFKLDFEDAIETLRKLCQQGESGISELDAIYSELTVRHTRAFAKYIENFLTYCQAKAAAGYAFDFGDCSIGNILLAGCFMDVGQDFNACVQEFSRICQIQSEVLNVTDGQNLVLVGLKEDGMFLKNEAEIVSKQNETKIRDIFLLREYLSEAELSHIQSLTLDERMKMLQDRSIFPDPNPQAIEALRFADVIIYGPGTQHSSLLPSYLTRGIGKTIEANTQADKIFISNIQKDHEIQSETANSLVRKLMFYMSCKNQWQPEHGRIVDKFFFQLSQRAAEDGDYVIFDQHSFDFPLEKVVLGDWESLPGKHAGGRVFDEIISIVNNRLERKIKAFPHQVSVIVPALNEERSVAKVLHDLSLLDFRSLGIGKEIVFVDGGSSDKTLELARKFADVKVYRLEDTFGRGAAIRLGISQATGNIIAFFPCDGEYDVKDLKSVVETFVRSDFKAIFGSRSIKCVNLTEQVKEIYPNNTLGYLISKYGGMLFSVLCLLLYNRYVSDVLTGIKVFDARLLKSLALTCKGVDLDLEIIAKLGRRRTFIFEIPVDYKARRKHEGKKTTTWDGLKGIWALLRFRLKDKSYAEKVVHSYSGVQ